MPGALSLSLSHTHTHTRKSYKKSLTPLSFFSPWRFLDLFALSVYHFLSLYIHALSLSPLYSKKVELEREKKMGGDLMAFLTMVIVQVGYAGMNILSKLAMDSGMNPLVHVAYRQLFATIVIAPFAYFLERY